jgi:hypothetical protein
LFWRSVRDRQTDRSETMAQVERYIVKIEEGEASSGDGVPSKGPVYRSVFAKEGLLPLPKDLLTTWDIFA